MMYKRTYLGQDYPTKHSPYRIGTGRHPAHPLPQETIRPVLLQSMEAAQTSQAHDSSTGKYDRGLNGWPAPGVGNLGDKSAKLIDLFHIAEKTSENRLILFSL